MAKGIVVTFDRLSQRMLGCYGSEWVETPNLDRLAASSMLFDRHYAEHAGTDAADHAWWSGCYQFPRTSASPRQRKSLAESLREHGVQTTLLLETDARTAFAHTGFQHTIEVAGADGLDVPPAETPFARLVSRGIEELNALKTRGTESWLLWLKSAGAPSPWIPPRDFAELYLDLLEEEADETGNSDQFVNLSEEGLEDLILAVAALNAQNAGEEELSDLEWRLSRAVYAGYVSLLDVQLGKLLDAVQTQFAEESLLLIVTAARGEALGTQSLVPEGCASLCDEIVRTPLMVALPPLCPPLGKGGKEFCNFAAGARSQALVSTVDLAPTLLDWFGISEAEMPCEGKSLLPLVRNEFTQLRDYLCLGDGDHTTGILTPELYLVRTERDAEGFNELKTFLFVKPDDVWDLQDVSAQSPENVEILSVTLDQFVEQTETDLPMEIPKLKQPAGDSAE